MGILNSFRKLYIIEIFQFNVRLGYFLFHRRIFQKQIKTIVNWFRPARCSCSGRGGGSNLSWTKFSGALVIWKLLFITYMWMSPEFPPKMKIRNKKQQQVTIKAPELITHICILRTVFFLFNKPRNENLFNLLDRDICRW